jgi:predicted transcriptional regulator
MSKSWKDLIKDSNERKVFEALADPNWDFRTINGLTKSSGLSKSDVESVIASYMKVGLIRESPLKDKSGRRIYTLGDKETGISEILGMVRGAITKSSSSP